MSLVGQRPPFRCEIDQCELWQKRKISFKPGMTCLWQSGISTQFRTGCLWIILLKLSCFYCFGLYRGMWLYASLVDLKNMGTEPLFSLRCFP